MKKHLFFLFAALVLMMVPGAMKAQTTVTIGDGTETTSKSPYTSYYNYSFVEQIYTAAEIGRPTGGLISSISFNMQPSVDQTITMTVFMKNVSRSTFSSNADYESVNDAVVVYEGSYTFTSGWNTIELSTPFYYNGTDNLMIAIDEHHSWSERYFYCTSVVNAVHSYCSDSNDPDPFNIASFSGVNMLSSNRPNLQITFAPNPIVQIGSGSQTNVNLPTNVNFKYSLTEQIYTEEEIGQAGDIYTIAFYNTSDVTTRNLNIYMSLTNQSTFSSGPSWSAVPSGSLVYSGDVTFLSDTWTTIVLNTPFHYSGSGNIMVVVDDNTGNKDYSLYFKAFDATAPRAWYIFNDNTNYNPTSSGSGWCTAINMKNQIRFGFAPVTCTAPTNLVVSNVASNGAGVNWEQSGSGNQWIVQCSTSSDFSNPSQVTVGSQSWYIYGLTPTTTYYVRVANSCGPENISSWSNTVTFTTTESSCITPTNLTVSNISYDGADLTWDQPGGGAEWVIEYSINPEFSSSSIESSFDSYFSLTGLDPITTYYVRVANDCGTMGNSEWVTTSFTTTGGAIIVPDIIDFETADFSQYPFDNDATYPWVVVAVTDECNTCDSYYMMSGNAGQHGTSSTIEATHTFPTIGQIAFDAKCMGEGTSWDLCEFFIDGVLQFSYGEYMAGWNHYAYTVTAGTHTFTWSYTKDGSVNPDGDAFFVDNIEFSNDYPCAVPENLTVTQNSNTHYTITWDPVLGATEYDFELFGNIMSATETTATIEGTLSEVATVVRVRAHCENGDVSDWAETTFTPTNIQSTADWYAYALNGSGNLYHKFISFSMQDLETVTPATGALSVGDAGYTYAADYANGYVWCITYDGNLARATVDEENHTISAFETVVTGIETGTVADMCYNPADGMMYYILWNSQQLKKFSLMEPYTVQTVGTSSILPITLAIEPIMGQAYAIQKSTGDLYHINLSDASATLAFSTGQTAQYAQSMAFDPHTGELFWAQKNDVDYGLYKLNLGTEAVSYLGKIGGSGVTQIPSLFMITCPAPTNVTVSNITPTTAEVSWDYSHSYEWTVKYSTDPTFATYETEWALSSTWPLTNLTPETTYYVQVDGFCYGIGGSAWSDVVSFTTPSELTVYDEAATNSYVPVYGFYADAYLKAEYIMNASELTDMTNRYISRMTFYATNPPEDIWDPASFKVFLKEVSFTTLDEYTGYGDATVVYEGSLYVVDDKMVVDFTTPYFYEGGNLLVGFYNTVQGNYWSCTWAGMTVDGASVQGYSYSSLDQISVNQRNFVPKTTFRYALSPALCPTPNNLTFANVLKNSAELSWNERGSASDWVVEYGTTADFSAATSINVFGVPEYTITGLTPETTYYVRVSSLCGPGEMSDWSVVRSFTTPEQCPMPTDIEVEPGSNRVTITWNGGTNSSDFGEFMVRKAGLYADTLFFDGFENGLDQWTVYVEGDASHNGWLQVDPRTYLYDGANYMDRTPYRGDYVAYASSYDGYSFNADNWLVTPQLELQGLVNFWVENRASSYLDSYEVLLSTGSNSPSDFTVTLQAMTQPSTEWSEVTLDLSAYAGQQGYIAIRQSSYDMEGILLDNFGVYNNYQEPSAWLTGVTAYSPATFEEAFYSNFMAESMPIEPGTKYDFMIMEQCDGGGGALYGSSSAWTEIHSFVTYPCEVSHLIVETTTNGEAEVSWTSGASVFELRYRPEGSGSWTTVTGITDNSYMITGLPVGNYEVEVAPNCDPTNFTSATFNIVNVQSTANWYTYANHNDDASLEYLHKFVSFSMDNPAVVAEASGNINYYVRSAACVDGQVWFTTSVNGEYVYRAPLDNVNKTIGAYETVSSLPISGTYAHAMSYNPDDGQIYYVVYNGSYTLNKFDPTLASPVSSLVGTFSISANALAINSAGEAYSLDQNGNLYQVNLTDATTTLVANTGKSTGNYWQSMAFDLNTGELFWSQYYENDIGLYLVEPATASVHQVGHIGDGNTQFIGMFMVADQTPTQPLVEIGSGDGTNNYLPTYILYNYTLSQQIYTATEIGQSGDIYSVAFYNTSTNGTTTRDIDIYMLHSDKTTFSDASDFVPVTAADRVFSGYVTVDPNCWITIEFSTPFAYNGTDNLILIVDDNTGTWTSSRYFRAFNAPSQAIHVYNDNTDYDPYDPSAYSGAVFNVKNQIQLGFVPILCHQPSNFTVSDVGKTSATLNWTGSSDATSWDICLNDDEAHLINVTSSPYTLTGLTPGADYVVKLRSNCGSDGVSEWKTANFTTLLLCTPPSVYVDEVGLDYATLYWSENGDATAWDICLDGDEAHAITLTSTSYTFTGLDQNTTYTVWVRSNCGGSDGVSTWKTVSFTTYECEAIGLSATTTLSGNANLTWGGYSPSFTLRYRLEGGSWTTVTDITDYGYTITGLPVGDYEVEVTPDCDPTDVTSATFSIMEVLSTANWYGHAVYTPGGQDWLYKYISFSVQNPAVVTPATEVLTTNPNGYTYAAALADGYVWCITVEGDLAKAVLDNDSKTISAFETVVPGFESTYSNSMSYNPVDGRMYYIMYSDHKLKSFSPSDVSDVVEVGQYSIDALTLAINSAGEAYCIEISTGDLYQINLTDASTTLVGNTGLAVSYAQDMAFDLQTGELFWAREASGERGLYLVSTSTATAVFVGTIGGGQGAEVTGLFMGESTTFSCPFPTNLTVYSAVETNAVMSWTENGSATSWDYQIDTDLNFPNGELNQYSVTDNPYTLSGLTTGTTYYVRVRANCGGGEHSAWCSPVSFTVYPCEAPDNVTVAASPNGTTSVSWNGHSDTYSVSYRPAGSSEWTTIPAITAQTYTFAGLPVGDYELLVIADCDPSSFVTTTFSIFEVLSTANWYGYGIYADQSWNGKYISFSMQDPGTVAEATASFTNTYAAAYADGYVWFIDTNNDLCRSSLDNSSKTISDYETIVPEFVTENRALAMSYNPVDGRFYYIRGTGNSSRTLISFDPANPTAVTEIGTFTNATQGLAINNAGEAYSVENTTGDLYRVNLTDATVTLVGNTGHPSYYVQDLAFDLQTGELFWAQYYSTSDNALYYVNPATAATMLIGHIGNSSLVELTGLFMVAEENPTCPAPTNLAVYPNNTNAVGLSWTESGTASDWLVQIDTDPSFPNGPMSEIAVSNTFASFDDLDLETTYYLRVRSYCGGDEFSSWVTTSFTTPSCPAPTNLTVSDVTTTSAVLDWDYGGAAYEWNVEYSTSSDFSSSNTEWVISSSWTMADLLPGTTYYVRVQSICPMSVPGGVSDVVSFTTDEMSCLAPTNLAYSNVTNHEATLSWTENGSAVIWYVMLNGDEAHAIEITDNPFTLTDLAPETQYDVAVRSSCDDGMLSPWSNHVVFTTLEACLVPTDLTVSATGATSAVLSWTSGDIYNLRYRASSSDSWVELTDDNLTSPATLTGLQNNTTYEVQAQRFCGTDGYSIWGNSVSFTTASCGTPTDLEFVSATATTITITWASGLPYNVWFRKQGGTTLASIVYNVTPPYTITDLEPGSTYRIRVQDICQTGTSTYSTYLYANTAACTTPDDVAVTDITDNSVTVSWTSGGTYNLRYRETGGAWTDVAEVTSPYTITGLHANLSYELQAQHDCDTNGVSDWGVMVPFTTAPCEPQTVPYAYDFEDGEPFYCWRPLAGSVTRTHVTAASNNHTAGGEYALMFSASASGLVALPQFVQETSGLQVMLWLRPQNNFATSNGTFEVGYLTDLADASTFTAVATYSYDNWVSNAYVRKIVAFPGAPAGSTIAFRHNSPTANGVWYVDDILVSALCPMPENITVTNVTNNSATVTWTDNGAASWDVSLVDLDAYANNTTTNSYTITGLNGGATYNVKVRSNCGDGVVSDWSAKVYFTTSTNVVPAYATITGENAVCQLHTTALTASTDVPATYLWNTGATTQSINAGPGTYTVTVTSSTGDQLASDPFVVAEKPNFAVTESRSVCPDQLPYTWNGFTFTLPGSQAVTLTASNGCDSIVTMHLSLNPIYTVPVTATICQGESYTFGGHALTVGGEYRDTLQTVKGCDSIIVLTLTVNPTYAVDDERTICQSLLPYTWNGVTFEAAGTKSATLQTVNGCDSVVTMTLHVNPTYTVPVTATICQGESYTFGGHALTVGGEYKDTLQTVNGCDSIIVLTLTVNPTYAVNDEQTICPSLLPYTWNGVIFNEAGTQNATLQTVNGCDSVVTMTLHVSPSYNVPVEATICNGEAYNFFGQLLTTSGVYTHQLQTVDGCDSIITLTLTVNETYVVTENRTVCPAAIPYVWNGVIFNAPGTKYVTLQTVNGCDSLVTMVLSVSDGFEITETREICNSELPYVWNGKTFTGPGTKYAELTASNGCDSVVTMVLVVNTPVHQAFTVEACGSYTWTDGVTYTTSGDHTYSHADAHGCTQVDTLHLTIYNPVHQAYTAEACGSYTWTDGNGQTYTASGVHTYSHEDAHGCTQVDTLHLTIYNPVHQSYTVAECGSYTWTEGNGQTYTTSGDRTYSHLDAHGCTQVDTLHLTIYNPVHQSYTAEACGSYTWIDGVTYTASGVHTYSHADAHGCTQVDTLHLTIHNPVHQAYNVEACGSYTWTEGDGQTYTTSGDRTYSHPDAHGCTQVDTLHLTIYNPVHQSYTEEACGSFTWIDGETYTASGVHTYSHADAHGCTQVDTLHLTIHNPVHTAITVTECGSYTWNGVTYTTSGNYTYSHADAHGCTQVDTLHLTINVPANQVYTVAECGSYTWTEGDGQTYTTSGVRTYSHTDANGCTQVDTLYLTILQSSSAVVANTVCAEDMPYEWNGVTFTQAGMQTATIEASNGCDSVVTMVLMVNTPVHTAVTVTECGSYTWNGTTYTATGNYTYAHPDVNGCTQVDTLHLTILTPSNQAYTVSECGSYTWTAGTGITYTVSGDYTYSHLDANGCTQVDTLHLTIYNPVHTSVSVAECGSYVWHGTTYTESGNYTYAHADAHGCTQVDTLHLTIYNPVHQAYNVEACGSYTWTDGDGQTYYTTGDRTYSHADAHGCTQVDTLHLTILQGSSAVVANTICAEELPYVWNGVTFTAAGIQTATIVAANGCDSVVTMVLTVNTPVHGSVTVEECGSYTWVTGNGQTYTASGDYTYSHQDVNGCTQVDTLHLTILTPTNTAVTVTECGSYTWAANGQTYTASGDYTYSHADANGCTQVDTLHLTIHNPVHTAITETACGSYTWAANGQTYTATGDYTYAHTDANGCTQVDTLHLTVGNVVTTDLYETSCGSYYWNNANYTETGNYTVTFTAAGGCDSVVTLHLTINQAVQTELYETACDSYTWADGNTYTQSDDYSMTLTAANGCDSVVVLHLTINNSTSSEFSIETSDSCYTWNGQTYCASGDYVQTLQTVNGCDSVVTLHLTTSVGVDNHEVSIVYLAPNPATTVCRIVGLETDPVSVELYDMRGKLLLRGDKTEFDVRTLPTGMYTVRVNTGNRVVNLKLIRK